MFVVKRSRLHLLAVPAVVMLLLVFAVSCSETPSAIDNTSGGSGGMSGVGDIDLGTTGSFLLGSVSDTSFAAGYIDVWASNVEYDASTGLVMFDIALTNKTEWPIGPPVHFVITSSRPADASRRSEGRSRARCACCWTAARVPIGRRSTSARGTRSGSSPTTPSSTTRT